MSMIVLSTAPGIKNTFIREKVSADGDCGYTAIARGINLKLSKLENSGSLRSQVADYIFKNWDNKLGDLDIKTIVKSSVLERQKKYNDFSDFFNIQDNEIKEDDDAIKNKYCSLLISSEPGEKLWIEDFKIKILEDIFKINIVTVNQKDNKWLDVSDKAASSSDEKNKIYILYNGVDHYDFLINIKDKIINSCLEKNKQLAATIAQYIDKTSDWLLRAKEQDIREEILKFLTTLEQKGQLELQKFYEELSACFFRKTPNTSQENSKKINTNQDVFEGFFKYFFDMMSSPKFIESFTKFCKILKTIFHKLAVAFNPGSALDDSEITGKYEEYGKYSEVFNAAGEAGRKFYRQLLERVDNGENFTSKQFLNVLLHTLKHDKAKLFSRSGHKMCTIMEEIILGDKDNFGQEIERNLTGAFKCYVDNTKYSVEQRKSLIDVVKQYAIELMKKIETIKNNILQEHNAENKNKLFEMLQYNRVKLVHFKLKIESFSEGNVLSIDPLQPKYFHYNFKQYLDKIINVQEIDNLTKALNDPHVGKKAELEKTLSEKINTSSSCGIFKLFVNHHYSNKLHIENKSGFKEVLAAANKVRGEDLLAIKDRIKNKVDNRKKELMNIKASVLSHDSQISSKITQFEKQLDTVLPDMPRFERDSTELFKAASIDKHREAIITLNKMQQMVETLDDNIKRWIDGYYNYQAANLSPLSRAPMSVR